MLCCQVAITAMMRTTRRNPITLPAMIAAFTAVDVDLPATTRVLVDADAGAAVVDITLQIRSDEAVGAPTSIEPYGQTVKTEHSRALLELENVP